jgi:hypothetical protein
MVYRWTAENETDMQIHQVLKYLLKNIFEFVLITKFYFPKNLVDPLSIVLN